MLEHVLSDSASLRARPGPRPTSARLVSGSLLAGVALTGIAFAACLGFCCIQRYDDEGVVLLFVQHLLDGHAIYDRVECLYGPFYLFARWVVFGVLGVPLGNDTLRAETIVTWLLTSLLLGATTWRLVRGSTYATGLSALVWILSMSQLFVFPREPGHPQEIVALLGTAALLVAVSAKNRDRSALLLLGGLGTAIALTKVNVGVFELLALTLSLLALTPRTSNFWRLVKFAAAGAACLVPWLLTRSGISLGYGGFCFLMTSALLPCLALGSLAQISGTVRLRDFLWCGLGAALVAVPMVAFALWQGNTPAGMVNALYLRTWHNFGGAGIGNPMPVSRVAMAFDVAAACIGLAALRRRGSWNAVLWPLRVVACVMIFMTAASRNYEVFRPIAFALPLVWLVLVPAAGHEPSEGNWFFRLFLAFTACLQPLQIFPVAGSQVFVGTLELLVVAVVLALDLAQEVRDRAVADPRFFASPVPRAKRLLLIAVAVASLRPRTFSLFGQSWTLASATSLWAIVAIGLGLIALRRESAVSRFLWPLRLIVGGWIVVGIASSPPWDMTWLRDTLPLAWLILVAPPGIAFSTKSTYVRLGLIAAAGLELVQLSPVEHFIGGPFHFAIFPMLAIAGLLFFDATRQMLSAVADMPRALRQVYGVNEVLLFVSLLIGVVAMLDAVAVYRDFVPLDLPGCRFTRMSEREAAYCTFLATNVRRSSDCVFARFALQSLHYWAEQRPASDVVPISNLWPEMDPISDAKLLEAHRNCPGMMFIDNPNPWNPVPPKMQFLDFVASHCQLLARLGPTRLLVRRERGPLELYDCAYQRRAQQAGAADRDLILRVPAGVDLKGLRRIELVDLDRDPAQQFLAASDRSDARLTLLSGGKPEPLNTAGGNKVSGRAPLRVELPAGVDLKDAAFPALRFFTANGRRLLTLPVVVDAAPNVQ